MGRPSSGIEKLPPYVAGVTDRHGKRRYRFRRNGFTTYLKEHPGTPKHPSAEYKALIAGQKPVNDRVRAKPGTIDELIQRFYGSAVFNRQQENTRRVARGVLEHFRAEHGDKRVATLKFQHVEAILLAKSKKKTDAKTGRALGGKSAAFNLRKQLNRLFDYAVKLEMIPSNPVDHADKITVPKGGFRTWTEEEIAQYQERHPVGTKARLALEIMLWTLQRRSDARLFGPAQIRGGKINYQQGKTGKDLWLPVPPQLREAIDATPTIGVKAFIVTQEGKPYSKDGFGNKMREWCDQAGLPQCSSHGLRKATARRLAELGISQQGIKASGGWSKDDVVSIYTAAADQERMAADAMGKLSAADLSNRSIKVGQSVCSTD